MTNSLAAAVQAAAGTGQASQLAPEPMTAERLRAEHPTVYSAILAEGANAETARIAGIEAALLPGHEKIVAQHKADRTKTPADAMAAVIAAENAARSAQARSLDDDEAKLAGLRSAPTATGTPAPKPAANAHDLARKAVAYQTEMAAKGIRVAMHEAVAHVNKEG